MIKDGPGGSTAAVQGDVSSHEILPVAGGEYGPEAAAKPPRRHMFHFRRVLGVGLAIAGLMLGAVMVTDPEVLDSPVGNAKVTANRVFGEVAVSVGLGPTFGYLPDPVVGEQVDPLWDRVRGVGRSSYLPEVTLGGLGGEAELDACTGEFIEMADYRAPGVIPLYSAHNTCEGDIILGWSIGQRVKVADSDVVYEVVEERRAITGDDAGILEGMPGELVLQTCFYGESHMRFLALSPVGLVGA